ncbi:bifunctional class I SAM-dependent methyltransferase/DEAD/DEAH box helicase [Asaia sp. As-1742]|uniref:bifunctional class I SAM-dependent methyltransferase/DEAD/DEAH box helicase n=1 Tax=Asaia sp. As-1742 TaxID=2608325 RepID=UPI0014203BA2|nr:bifunctional class I SAM-dependent methyltransferase/DEAD/DEAH box helicase [Asaia sp. As-1742]NIE81674.1 methylase [Asaia sp. As-1742]
MDCPVTPIGETKVNIAAARLLLAHLERGEMLDASRLRQAMESAFKAPDATGAWDWKMAYDAAEAASVLFLRRYGPALMARASGDADLLTSIARLASLLPSQTRRSDDSQTWQQFSTPLPLAFCLMRAADFARGEHVLEPSAGTGLLALFAELAGASLTLNELAPGRADLLAALFPAARLFRHDAAQIHDYLPQTIQPDVVLMNPPFSATVHVAGRAPDTTFRHIASALDRLRPGGRLVALTGLSFCPDNPRWTDGFTILQAKGRLVFSAGVAGQLYRQHGTSVETRLLVFDRTPASEPSHFVAAHGTARDFLTLLGWITGDLPPRQPQTRQSSPVSRSAALSSPRTVRGYLGRKAAVAPRHRMVQEMQGALLSYDILPSDEHGTATTRLSDALYEDYRLQTLAIPGARPHPTKLVQSAAMASVRPPGPSHKPTLPDAVIHDGLLSDAQLESVIYAGQAHDRFLAGRWKADQTWDILTRVGEDDPDGVRFRRGWFLGDGTGTGKGRQVAGIILDNWLNGRRRAVWVSKSDKLLEDAQRDWSALGMERLLVTPQSRFSQGTAIRLTEGILFTTYAQRLGLWGGEDFPFVTRADFIAAIEAGGVAAMEVLARDLKAMGLYTARSLSYDGVEYELVEHQLTPEQIRIYDAFAQAFMVIHNNLDAAMQAANITGTDGTLNRQAKAAARSAFESTKQRFFNHLITAMKTVTLIRAIERDLAEGQAAVIQLVSTGEALTERRLAEIPPEDWNDLRIDVTPREYVLGYLEHSFPVQLYEPYSDGSDHVSSRPVFHDGKPVLSREAVARRDAMIEQLAALPALPGALDQIIQHFGTDAVAEVTGRSRRVVRKGDRLAVESRPAAASLIETQAFMDDTKRILVFSDAGGTGRSYHAELSAANRRLRVHYLLEPGWKADAAIQGLGRTNRTNQAQPPLFRPIATDVKAEKRFLSTIARRLDTLGAITRGQRQTGGQGLFRPEDNLESPYARDALRQFYRLLAREKVEGCTLAQFEDTTGLSLVDDTGLKDKLPPISTFLNRMLALPVALQNLLFATFEDLLAGRVEAAVGVYDAGLETLRADSFTILARQTIHTHAETGADTDLLTIRERRRSEPVTLSQALALGRERESGLVRNTQSGRIAVRVPAPGLVTEDGEFEWRVRLVRPMDTQILSRDAFAASHWKSVDADTFAALWEADLRTVDEFVEAEFHMVTGLLLPVWKRLPTDHARVYRLQTDDGERVLGRRVPVAWATSAGATGSLSLSGQDARSALLDGGTVLHLAERMQVRRVRVMGRARIELTGFTEGMRERLRAYGLFSEIISWTLRFFVPVDDAGDKVLERLFETWPIARVTEREAA